MLPMLLLSVATASANTDATDELRAWRDDAAACRIGSNGVQKFYDKCMKRKNKINKKVLKDSASSIKEGKFLAIAEVDERLNDIAADGSNPLATPRYHVSHVKCDPGDITKSANADWETRAVDALQTARKLQGASELTAYLLDQNDQKKAPQAKHVAVLKEVFASVDSEQFKSEVQELQASKPANFDTPVMYLCVAPLSAFVLFKFPFIDDANSAQKELLATFPE